VQLGEYSDGCVCQVKPAPGAPPAEASGLAPAAGVYMQMVADEEAQRRVGTGAAGSMHPYVPGSPTGSPGWRPGLP
jgi:hypothetical protein